MNTSRGYKRAERVSRDILKTLTVALSQRTSDPALKKVVLTHLGLTDDLKTAKVYWTLMRPGNQEDIDAAHNGFKRATSHLRRTVAAELSLRSVPTLRFYYDSQMDDARRMEQVLSNLAPPPADS